MSSKISMLLIDDNDEFNRLVGFHLNPAAFDVNTALNGPEGLDMAEKLSLDVILLDWDMPEMDGLEVLAKLKEKDETKNIPVIMLTGRSGVSEIENAFDLGIDSYITKPVQFQKLAEILKEKLKEINSIAG